MIILLCLFFTQDRYSPLLWACHNRLIDVAELLINKEASIDVKDLVKITLTNLRSF